MVLSRRCIGVLFFVAAACFILYVFTCDGNPRDFVASSQRVVHSAADERRRDEV